MSVYVVRVIRLLKSYCRRLHVPELARRGKSKCRNCTSGCEFSNRDFLFAFNSNDSVSLTVFTVTCTYSPQALRVGLAKIRFIDKIYKIQRRSSLRDRYFKFVTPSTAIRQFVHITVKEVAKLCSQEFFKVNFLRLACSLCGKIADYFNKNESWTVTNSKASQSTSRSVSLSRFAIA